VARISLTSDGGCNPIPSLGALAKMKAVCCFFGNSFALPHPPIDAFVANKDQSAIRKDCHRAVEVSFSACFGLESRSIFLPLESAKFTLSLIAKGLNADRWLLVFTCQGAFVTDHGNAPIWKHIVFCSP
jgi:hypothetical protein